MYQLILVVLRLLLGLLSVGAIFAGIFMMGSGFKGDPVNEALGTQGFLLMLGGLFLFPSRQHILYRLWTARQKGRPTPRPGAEPAPSSAAQRNKNIARPAAVIPDRLGKHGHLYQGRVRLDFILPPPDPDRATSWIGGLPRLPAEVKWPLTADHNPMLFLAQIAMADLPPTIWGGKGPRSGSLAFFTDLYSNCEKVAVLHVDGPLKERAYPSMLMSPLSLPVLRRGAVGEQLAVAPETEGRPLVKWPVRATPVDPQDQLPSPYFKSRDPDNAATVLRNRVSLSDPAFVPYDWPTLIELVTSLVSELNGSVQRERRAGILSDPFVASQTDRLAVAKTLVKLREALRKRAQIEPFTADHWDNLVKRLSEIRYRPARKVMNPATRKAEDQLLRSQPVLDALQLDRHFASFEYLSRLAYAAAPDRLPPLVRAALEPLWQHDAVFEVAAMGGQIDLAAYVTADRSDLVCLLEIPCSDLIGARWHDLSSLGVFLAPESLANGQFGDAVGQISES